MFPLLLASINIPKIKAEYEFRKACAGHSGFFVYREVSLGPEYLLPIDPEIDSSSGEAFFTANPGHALDQEIFDRDFKIELEFQQLETGNAEMSTTLTNSRTGEVLSEFKDFSAQLSFFMSQTHRTCRHLGHKDVAYSSASDRRLSLMKRTFNFSY